MPSLKVKFRKSKIFPLLNQWWMRHVYNKWLANGSPVPPPHEVKQKVITDFQKQFSVKTFVETGTYTGKMVLAMLKRFEKIISIELDMSLANKAKEIFSDRDHVSIHQGDSGVLMSEVLSDINEPCIFWLDGHYSGGVTAEGEKHTPILSELEVIFRHSVKNHIILIDDVHCFVGDDEYPTPDEIKNLVKKSIPDYNFEIRSNIMCIYPDK